MYVSIICKYYNIYILIHIYILYYITHIYIIYMLFDRLAVCVTVIIS